MAASVTTSWEQQEKKFIFYMEALCHMIYPRTSQLDCWHVIKYLIYHRDDYTVSKYINKMRHITQFAAGVKGTRVDVSQILHKSGEYEIKS